MYVYALRLRGGYFYVGSSRNPWQRFQEHKLRRGSTWTKIHQPMNIVRLFKSKQPETDENNTTKELMKIHGIDKVRGGIYVSKKLPEYQERTLLDEMAHSERCCFICHQPYHFASQCWKRNIICFVCGQKGHLAKECDF